MKAALPFCMLAGAFAAASPAPAPAQSRSAEEGQTIVVTGRRLEDTKRALDQCLARKCPPLEDMAATMAHAENLFISGDYRRARSTIQASVGRNDRYAGRHPLEVATLYRADSRISIHLGDGETYRNSAFGAVRALRKGLDEKDLTVITARFEVADMLARLGHYEEAGRTWQDIARDSRKIGARDLAATAQLREAWMEYRRHNSAQSLRLLESLGASTDPELKSSRLGALLFLARIDREKGRPGGPDRLLKALAEAGTKARTLLWAPRIDVGSAYQGKRAGSNFETLSLPTDQFEKTWADVGFWVKPDGSVGDVEILRSNGSQAWLKPVLSSIGGRIYSPAPDSPANYRVERYTWTSLVGIPSGTRLPRHSPQGRIEFVDLTPDPPKGQGSR